MVHVEGGRFMMGSEEGKDNERPIHAVKLFDFYMGKYLITNEQFLPFLNEMGNQEEGGRQWVSIWGKIEDTRHGIIQTSTGFECFAGFESCPTIYVSWYGANAYCKWLSKKTGQKYRLPSESEWEYAARGGKHSKGYRYAGSNKLKKVGWFGGNSHIELKAVGQKYPNEIGLYDMSGNVWEWCADVWHANYKGAPQDGSAWLEGGEQDDRVVRGGSWDLNDDFCRVSYRGGLDDYSRDYDMGFRIVRY